MSAMTVLLKSRVTAIGPEVADLAEGGVLILFADGSPPELAEVSVLHAIEQEPSDTAPQAGASLSIGPLSATITAVGPSAWSKVLEMGHVVISFNGASHADRPGEICASAVDPQALIEALKTDAIITVAA